MKDLEELLAKCEANAISDSQIDTSELPEITDFSGFEPMHPEYFKAKVNDFLMASYLAGDI